LVLNERHGSTHGIDASGRVVVAKAIRRNKLLENFKSRSLDPRTPLRCLFLTKTHPPVLLGSSNFAAYQRAFLVAPIC
jgi:hypothetical protein